MCMLFIGNRYAVTFMIIARKDVYPNNFARTINVLSRVVKK